MRLSPWFSVLVFAALLLLPELLAGQSQDNPVTLHFKQVDTIFPNPGQGWMIRPSQQPRFPATVLYLRFNWADVELEDGVYNWKPIDQALTQARQHQQTLGMRVMTANAHSTTPYTSPKWLFDEGCRSFTYTNDGADHAAGGAPMTRVEPDYSDPLYLAKHAAFLKAMGERYNGDPAIEFLDIGSYGIWGEWHTTHPASVAVRTQIVDMYLHAFSKTHLVYMSDDAEVMAYAIAHGAGLRRDGVGSPWHEARWAGTPAYAGVPAMGEVWKHAPIVFEWYLDYVYMHGKGWSLESAVNFMLTNHVSIVNDNLGTTPPEVQPLLEKLARLAGARFVLRTLTQPQTAQPGTAVSLEMTWANVGVAPLYQPYRLTLGLRDAKGKIVVSSAVPVDLEGWIPGEYAVVADLQIPLAAQPGEYAVVAGIFDPGQHRPPLHLAFDAPEAEGWYQIGKLTLK